ncbi:uncharacterized protein LOC125233485 [Leguminivora glycinivorella]|uniref:uncharacterized protein LOC125233485 n=1 Tax=Leguminivora glycinivorella TaxID=1035111 RepID=UPI00200E1D99|nr:uncharacterized protein LOC125233485 [Leguminivora glycinivorella]
MPWYNFWKHWRKPATRTNAMLHYFYCRSKNFSQSVGRHLHQWGDGIHRLWFVFWLGVCPERIKTTIYTIPTKSTTTTTPWPRGRSRKNPLLVGTDEWDWTHPVTKPPATTKSTTRCAPVMSRPKLHNPLLYFKP